ncbi:hypothetical protein N7523_001125 [Penicillium sp. IBT 18751x]|nr:hypothetical protein N7523_002018 [Penicillium sp. IBT 18751x]KAJ6134803.1 hypothetical protein N7523_001125 [Penicillium sp. IBT 18751x]
MSSDESALATTDKSLNFDLEWSYLEISAIQEDYTTILQLYSGDLTMDAPQGYMGYGAAGKV